LSLADDVFIDDDKRNFTDTMIRHSYFTPTMLRQCAWPAQVGRIALLSRFDGRSVPIDVDGGGGDP